MTTTTAASGRQYRRPLRRQRRRIGMIFQEYALVERLTVMENVLSGRLGYVPFWRSWLRRFPSEDVRRAYALLDRVGLLQHADKRADALSGGQRQRVGIARALAQEPDLLLVDEPTASLDPKTSRQIMRLLTEICAERRLPAIVNIHDVPAFIAIGVFRWDINIRESTILGLVGAGGIGLQLQSSINVLAWPQVTMILLLILGTVVVSEWVSATLRRAMI